MSKSYYPIVTKQEMSLPFYIATVGTTANDKWVQRPQGIQDYQILYTEQGIGVTIIRGKEYEITPHTILFLPPFTPHEYYAKKEPWTTHWVTFNGFATEGFFDFDAEIWQLPADFSFYNHFEKIVDLKHDDKWSKNSSILLYELLLDCRECVTIDNMQIYRLRNQLEPIFRYLNENYMNDLQLSELADLIHVTPGYFCKIFKSFTNMRPFEYITHLRIQKAKTLLVNQKKLTVAEIGSMVGYQSNSYFAMIFKSLESMTPSQFQEYYGKD